MHAQHRARSAATRMFLEAPSRLSGRSCVVCTSSVSCSCAADEECKLSVQTCSSCATTTCVKISSGSSSDSHPSASVPIGAIVGAVIGGLAVLTLVMFFVYKYFLAKKIARRREEEAAREKAAGLEFSDVPYGRLSPAARSTRTVVSMASTALTRASNIIPIAYIPGVINRSNPHGGEDVPPVPAMPHDAGGPRDGPLRISTTLANAHSVSSLQMPLTGNSIANSASSIISSFPYPPPAVPDEAPIRSSIMSYDDHRSIRTSVATTAYRSTAIITPAMMTAISAKPNLVTLPERHPPSRPTAGIDRAGSSASVVGGGSILDGIAEDGDVHQATASVASFGRPTDVTIGSIGSHDSRGSASPPPLPSPGPGTPTSAATADNKF
ncbi:uncharacterized protein V1510DRAFT_418576 [Dipodascopsis tothii]|uniref:uncharacterized protein n=1 Tax=Dipodascopsis tothii TaxID=44089 RepID=UPI0034CF9C82